MTPADFLSRFGTLADAPNGIPKLRELILQLAVQGKLVPQDPGDEPASALVARLGVESEFDAEDDPTTILHPVPGRWAVERLGRLVRAQAGFAFQPRHFNEARRGVQLIRIRDIRSSETQIHYDGEYREEFLVANGDYLVGMDGQFTVARWRGGPALLNQRVCRLQFRSDELAPSFFAIALQLHLREIQFAKSYTTVQHLSNKQIESAVVPVPPLPEQHRIVAKVDELMALCDELEARQERQRTTRRALTASSLDALANAPDADSLAKAWPRVRDHLADLITEPESIPTLRQAILQLAVRGQLVPQDPNDEPVAGGCVDDAPFEVPVGWAWARLSDVSLGIDSGWSPSCEERPRTSDEWGVLKVSAVSWGRFKPEENKALPRGLEPRRQHQICSGDYLMSRANTAELVGRSVIVMEAPPRLLMSDKILRVRLSPRMDVRFMKYWNASADARAYYAPESSGTSASMRNISRDVVNALPVPLPPVPEQHRIVAKVDELMALCDQLEARLTQARATTQALASSTTHHLVTPRDLPAGNGTSARAVD